MTNRFSYDKYWAQAGEATDPDLDTEAPSFKPNRYQSLGWEAEKPPEDWQNFLLQISDLKLIEYITRGIPMWDVGVEYRKGAVAFFKGKLYHRSLIKAGALSPDQAASGWELATSTTETNLRKILADLNKKYADHLAATNPHADTLDNVLGGLYSKPVTDKFFNNPTDPRTIVYHKAQKGAVHGETAEQLDTVSKSRGGMFAGDVSFLKKIILEVGKTLDYNPNTGRLEMCLSSDCLSVDGGGSPRVNDDLLLTDATYDDFEIRANNKFALPVPRYQANFETSLDDFNGIGWDSVQSEKDPVFEVGLGLVTTDNVVTTDHPRTEQPLTAHIICVVDGVVRSLTSDASSITEGASIQHYLSWFGVPEATHVKQLTFYPRLSTYQKSMLVK